MQWNQNIMQIVSGCLLLLAPLLVATAARAEPSGSSSHGVDPGAYTPATRLHHPNPDLLPIGSVESRSGLQYGSGYRARHGSEAEARQHRNSRMEGGNRLQYPASGTGRQAIAGHGGRGR